MQYTIKYKGIYYHYIYTEGCIFIFGTIEVNDDDKKYDALIHNNKPISSKKDVSEESYDINSRLTRVPCKHNKYRDGNKSHKENT